MLTNYFPVLLFIIVGLGFGVVLTVVGKVFTNLLGLDRPDPSKGSPSAWCRWRSAS